MTLQMSVVRADTGVVYLFSGRVVSTSYACNAMNVRHWGEFSTLPVVRQKPEAD
jgi:hypothetical protein